MTLDECKRRHILRALIRHGWHKMNAKRELAVAYSTLYRYMEKFKIPIERPSDDVIKRYEDEISL